MSHGLYPNLVTLDKEQHRYFHQNGDEFLSFSKLSEYIIPPFDRDSVSYFVAKAQGKTQDEVKQEWTSRTENGSRIDKALEVYAQDGIVFSEDLDVMGLINSISEEYKDYHKSYEQLVLYNEQYRVAGSTDKLFVFGNRKDSNFGISDFKVYEKPQDLTLARGWCKAPFEHLPKSKFTKINFQLSIYAFMFEQLTGRRCRELFIHVIDSVNNTHKKVHIPYLKNDVLVLLETYKDDILKRLMPESVF